METRGDGRVRPNERTNERRGRKRKKRKKKKKERRKKELGSVNWLAPSRSMSSSMNLNKNGTRWRGVARGGEGRGRIVPGVRGE